ncbi:MAG: BrnT family toxin [Aestuariivirga sp.]
MAKRPSHRRDEVLGRTTVPMDWELTVLPVSNVEWNHERAERNIKKHGVGFEDAARIFLNPIVARDDDHGEEFRTVAIGLSGDRVLVVVFTERRDAVRIISARKATAAERKRLGAHLRR